MYIHTSTSGFVLVLPVLRPSARNRREKLFSFDAQLLLFIIKVGAGSTSKEKDQPGAKCLDP